MCIQNVNIEHIGSDEMSRNRLHIVPNLNFYCNARISKISVRLLSDDSQTGILYIQVWRPSSPGSKIYNKIAQVPVTDNDISRSTYLEANIVLTGTNRILVQSGDVIVYYHPPDSRYQVRSIETAGYFLFTFIVDGSYATSVNLHKANYINGLRQPSMLFTTGK